MVGQEHITQLLRKALDTQRIAHAYLFCGPRGIGKTSCARILAKALNCEKGPTLEPCGTCPACKEITQGNSFDVLEIDGASNRGIDEIRTLRENVKFAPSYGRYKIYIVDEVHMLTSEAFNALLKTLEEPPPHVKFIFATTDINKVPVTIISRCQRFDFKRIPLKTIAELLADICKKEKFKADPEALLAIAKAAQGSLRDSLSILDQLSALSEESIKAEDVSSMLGTIEVDLLFELTDALAERNCAASLQIVDRIVEKGKDIKQLGKDLVEHFRNLMVIKIGGKTLGRLVDYPVEIKEQYLTQSAQFSIQEILAAIDMFIEAAEMSRVTESFRIAIEIALAKLAYPSANNKVEGGKADRANVIPARLAVPPAVKPPAEVKETLVQKLSPVEILKNQKGEVNFGATETEPEALEPDLSVPAPATEKLEAEAIDLEKIKRGWDALTHAISREKMSVATYLQDGMPIDWTEPILTIGFGKTASFHKESLETPINKRLIETIFSEKLNRDVVIKFKIIEAPIAHTTEPFIKTALDTFNGKVVSKWHNE